MLRTSTSRGAVPSLHDEPVRQHLKAQRSCGSGAVEPAELSPLSTTNSCETLALREMT